MQTSICSRWPTDTSENVYLIAHILTSLSASLKAGLGFVRQ